MFRKKWILTTLLVILGAALCIRLGIWQLDRLDQRRTFNAHYLSMLELPPLDLNADTTSDLTAMEYRSVTVRGTYDFDNQVALLNYYNEGVYGYHLFTPLLLADGRAVLVDRGWIPAEGNDSPSGWMRYEEAAPVQVQGVMRLGVTNVPFGGRADPPLAEGQTRLDFWNFANLERIGRQIPYPILPVYIQPTVDLTDAVPPIPSASTVEITEGPHMGYAIQWFFFASLLLVGYPFFLRKQEQA
ncbi:MAG: SURF1 family protein [Chloroflexota bacterium]